MLQDIQREPKREETCHPREGQEIAEAGWELDCVFAGTTVGCGVLGNSDGEKERMGEEAMCIPNQIKSDPDLCVLC